MKKIAIILLLSGVACIVLSPFLAFKTEHKHGAHFAKGITGLSYEYQEEPDYVTENTFLKGLFFYSGLASFLAGGILLIAKNPKKQKQ